MSNTTKNLVFGEKSKAGLVSLEGSLGIGSANKYEENMCKYSHECEKVKDPDYFFTRCINNGEGCQVKYRLDKRDKRRGKR